MYPRSVDEHGTALEFLSDKTSFSKVSHESVPSSQDGQGLELPLLQTSIEESIQPVTDSGFVSRGPAEAEAVVESVCQAFEKTAPSEELRNAMPLIEVFLNSNAVVFVHLHAIIK